MVKYLGPKLKKLKRLNLSFMPGFSTKFYFKYYYLSNKKYNISNYYLNLLEKQKLKFLLNLKENKIKHYMFLIKKYKNINLTLLINLRLDVMLYNIGFTKSIIQSRQLINHGFILINYKTIKQPSYKIKLKNIISLNYKNKNIIKLCRFNLLNKYKSNNLFINRCKVCLNLLKVELNNINLYSNYMWFKFNTKSIYNYY